MAPRIDEDLVAAITSRVLRELDAPASDTTDSPADADVEPDRQPYRSFGDEVRACATTAGKRVIPVGISARHAHVTPEHLEVLYGDGHKLNVHANLYQPGEFASKETVAVVGPRMRMLEHVRILGPTRKYTQVELSGTDCIYLGVDAPLRESGKLEGAAEVTLVGPKGALHLRAGIRATRHIHLNPTEAAYYGVEPGQLVRVRIPGPHALTFENVLVRVSPNVIAQMHLHTDDANSAGLRGGEGIELILC